MQKHIQTDTQPQTLTAIHSNLMLEHMRIGMALYDAQEFRLLAVNKRFKLFLQEYLCPGKSYELAIGCPLRTLLPPPKEVAKAILNIFRTVVETGESYEVDKFPIPTVGKGLTYWQWTLDPVRDASGTITHLLHSANDVTPQVLALQQAEQANISLSQAAHTIEIERKRLEVIEAVASSMRNSFDMKDIGQAAIDAINAAFNPICVAIHTADPVKQSLHLLHIAAIPEAMHFQDILQEVPYGSDFIIANAIKQKKPIFIENMQDAARREEIDNNYPAVKFGAQGYICIPLWTGDQPEGMLAACFREIIRADGTEAKTLEGCSMHIASALAQARLHTEIEQERARLRAVLDQLPEGVLLIDAPHGHIQYANAAAVQIVGSPIMGHLDASVKDAALMRIILDEHGQPLSPEKLSSSRALLGETANGQEVTLTRQDGSEAFLLTSAAPLRKDDGTIIGAIGVFQDITARKSIEQKKDVFLSIASHELRTPITAILGLAELLQMWVGHPENPNSLRCQRALTSIAEQGKRLTRLIEEMLDLSRIENTHLLLNIAPHNLIQTLTQVIESQSMMTKHNIIHFILDGVEAHDTLTVYFDEDRIIQVLNNLISNAVKYSPTHTDIEVGLRVTEERPDEAIIWVRDQGIGIAAKELPHIYERFHRASNLDRAISGLGIGLYLVHELATRHGGHVWAESIEGKGSTFYVNLPLIHPA